jgi:hypothetical protein
LRSQLYLGPFLTGLHNETFLKGSLLTAFLYLRLEQARSAALRDSPQPARLRAECAETISATGRAASRNACPGEGIRSWVRNALEALGFSEGRLSPVFRSGYKKQ